MDRKTRIKGGDKCIHCHPCQKHCSFLTKYGVDIGDTAKLGALACHCFLCGRCSEVCPIRIDGRGIILGMRRAQVEENGGECREKGYSILLSEKKDYIFRSMRHMIGRNVLFPGRNFPSFYPGMTRKLIKVLKDEVDMSVLFDYYGKPVSELGLEEQEEKIIRWIDEKLHVSDIQEIVMLCPNCYYFLKNKLEIRVLSIYEKLSRLGIGRKIEDEGGLFLPCPDREEQQWVSWLNPFLQQGPETIKGTQCYGLGGCAGRKEPNLAGDMACHVAEEGYKKVYTYCVSCAGNLTHNGCEGASHPLTEILDSHEQPDVARSMINRIMTKFW